MKVWMEYRPERVHSPLSYWMHCPVDSDNWFSANEYDPSMPKQVPGRGWPIYLVEHRGRQLYFASHDEIDHAIDVLRRELLPTTQDLAERAGWPHFQHGHWLTKLSKFRKLWKIRKVLIDKLEESKRKSS
jgi:hypothetical protein